MRAFEALASLATRAGVEGARFRIHTPLITLTKADIIRRGLALGLDYGLTHSCYSPATMAVRAAAATAACCAPKVSVKLAPSILSSCDRDLPSAGLSSSSFRCGGMSWPPSCSKLRSLLPPRCGRRAAFADERTDELRQEVQSVATHCGGAPRRVLRRSRCHGVRAGRATPTVLTLERPALERFLGDVLRDRPLLANLVLTTTDGRMLATGAPVPPALEQVSWPYIADVARTDRPTVTDLAISPVSGRPVMMFALSGARPGRPVAAVLGVGVHLSELQRVFARVPLPEGSVVTVTDRQGRVLARTLEARSLHRHRDGPGDGRIGAAELHRRRSGRDRTRLGTRGDRSRTVAGQRRHPHAGRRSPVSSSRRGARCVLVGAVAWRWRSACLSGSRS